METNTTPTPDSWLAICEKAAILPDSVVTDAEIVERAAIRRSVLTIEEVAAARAEMIAYEAIPKQSTRYTINLKTGVMRRIK